MIAKVKQSICMLLKSNIMPEFFVSVLFALCAAGILTFCIFYKKKKSRTQSTVDSSISNVISPLTREHSIHEAFDENDNDSERTIGFLNGRGMSKSYSKQLDHFARKEECTIDVYAQPIIIQTENDAFLDNSNLKDVEVNYTRMQSDRECTSDRNSGGVYNINTSNGIKNSRFMEMQDSNTTTNPYYNEMSDSEKTTNPYSSELSDSDITVNPYCNEMSDLEKTTNPYSSELSDPDITMNPYSNEFHAIDRTINPFSDQINSHTFDDCAYVNRNAYAAFDEEETVNPYSTNWIRKVNVGFYIRSDDLEERREISFSGSAWIGNHHQCELLLQSSDNETICVEMVFGGGNLYIRNISENEGRVFVDGKVLSNELQPLRKGNCLQLCSVELLVEYIQ